jgi:hypothetical protein
MTVIDLTAWAHRLDVEVAEIADVLNGSTRRAGELLRAVVRLEEALRRNPDPEIRVALRSAETALAVVSRRLEEVWLVARREAR